VVLGPSDWSARPLSVYLPAQELDFWRPFTTREVVVVGAATGSFARACSGGALCGMAPSQPGPSPVPGLTKVSERRVADGRFIVARYVSPVPVTIGPETRPGFGTVTSPGAVVQAYRQLPPGAAGR
jgi:hypothetical protein